MWVRGRYVVARNKVWVPATDRKQYVAPIFETRYESCGDAYSVQVGGGTWTKVKVPGHHEVRESKRWTSGYWRNTRRHRRH